MPTDSLVQIQQAPANGTVNSSDSSTIITSTTVKRSACQSALKTFIQKHRKWLLWWNSEEWWACWIGLIFFGVVNACVKHDIPQPEFLPWQVNPFDAFATTADYGIIVLFPAMGILVWLGLASIQAKNWTKFPMGYTLVFFIAHISSMLASNGTYWGDSLLLIT
jgi:hypothetical protein